MLTVLNTTLCAEWNGFLGGMWNIMEHVNLSSSERQVQATLYSINGQAASTQNFSVLPGAQSDLIVHDLAGWTLNSYGKVCSSLVGGVSGDLDGRMVYYKPASPAGSYQFAFAMPFLNGTSGVQFVPFNTYQPSLDPQDANNLVANWIQLTNLETSEQRGALIFHAQDGSVLGQQQVVLPGQARQDFSGHQFGRNLVGIIEWQPSGESAKFQLRNVRYFYDNAAGENSFDTAFQLEGAVGSGRLLAAPLDTAGASAILEVANTANSQQSITVDIYRSDGTLAYEQHLSLPAYGSVHLITDSVLHGGSGIAAIQGSVREGVIATAMQYGRTASAGLKYMYGIQAREALGAILRSSYNTFLNQGCRLIALNPTATGTSATVTMVRYDGTQPLSGHTLSIAAHGLVDFDLCTNDTADVYGVVSVQPQAPNMILGSVVRVGSADQYRFPTPLRQ